jgi:hypothetical protein
MGKKFSLNANQPELDFRCTKKGLTEIAQLHPYELIGYIIHNNPAFKGPKGIAVDTQVDISTVYRWAENPKNNGIELISDRMINFIKSTKSANLIIRYIRARCGE